MCKKSNKRRQKVDNLFLSNNQRGEKKKVNKFKKHKDQTIKSLQEVENFLKEGFICLQGNKQNRLK